MYIFPLSLQILPILFLAKNAYALGTITVRYNVYFLLLIITVCQGSITYSSYSTLRPFLSFHGL